MAGWLDFINALNPNEDDKKRRQNDFLSSIAGFANDVASTGQKVGQSIWGGVKDFEKNITEPTLKGASDFLTDTLQGIPRGVVNTYLTLEQGARDDDLKRRNETIDKLKSVSESERERIADQGEKLAKGELQDKDADPRAFTFYQWRKMAGGNLSDKNLDERRAKNDSEMKTDKTFKPENDFLKFLLGGEDDEVAQSAQKTSKDAETFLEGQGIDKGTASFVAPVVGAGSAALDVPTGVGNLVKGIGVSGIKQLAKEGTEEGVANILKSNLPKMADDAIKNIAPQLAAATDEKAVKAVLENAGRNVIKPLADPIAAFKGNFKGGIDDTKQVIDTLRRKRQGTAEALQAPEMGVDASRVTNEPITPPTPPKPGKPTGYGDATDELLGNVKSSSELNANKPGFKQSFREQFVDKLSPVNDMVKTIEEKVGRKLGTEDNPYQLMRLYQGMPDRVQTRVQGLTDILKQSPDINSVKAIGMARQIIDRGERGISSTISPERARQVIEEQRSRLGDVEFDKAAKIVDSVNEYNRGLLDDLHEAGIVSDDAFKAINEVGANYFSKFNVIEHIMKNDQNRALFSSSGSYNTTKQSLNKILSSAKGMEEGTEVLDPIESIVRSTDQTMRAIAKNDIWHAFDRLADEVPDMIVRARDPGKVAERIALSLDNKEMRPIRDSLDSMMKTRGGWVRKLESEINKLEQKGFGLALKKGGQRMDSKPFAPSGLGGDVPTSQAGKLDTTATDEATEMARQVQGAKGKNAQGIKNESIIEGIAQDAKTLPSKLGASDTGSFVRNLIENGAQADIDKLKGMVGTRDAKLSGILDEISTMKTKYDEVAGKVRENADKIRGLADTDAPEGMSLISGFGKGIQGKLAVPKEIADVFTGKNKAQQDYLTSMISDVNSFVKQNFTSNNPVFALITNPIRDAKTFAYNAQDVKANPVSIGSALLRGMVGRIFKDADYKRWVEAGGRSGFYADERMGSDIARDVSREVQGKKVFGVKVAPVHNVKEFLQEASRVAFAPLRVARDTLHGAASILEDTPRLAQFKASKKAGKSDLQAAFNSRNVTVDFQQSGRIGQTVNAWIPFLNARFQGTLKNAEAIKRNPARATAVYAGLTAAPILLAAANNAQHPDVMKMIPDEERDNNFIMVFGDAKDEKGNFTQVIKIPKSDVDKILGKPLEEFARFLADDDPDGLGEIITNMIGSTVPFDTVRDDKFSLERTVGSLLPPVVKAPVEAVTNRNLYFGSDIVPQSMQDLPAEEQKRENTSPVAEWLAPLLGGGSPIVSENTLRNFTGSLLTKPPQDQLGGKLSGANSNRMTDEFYKTLDKTSKNKESASRFINEALSRGDLAGAQQAAQTYNDYLKETFTPFAERYGGDMTQELADIYDEQKILLTKRSIKQRQRNQLERQAAQ